MPVEELGKYMPLLVGALVLLLAVQFVYPGGVTGLLEKINVTQSIVEQAEAPEINVTPPKVVEAAPAVVCGEYTLGTSANPVRQYIKDKLNPKAGVANVEVEVLTPDQIASDPMREVTDEDTATASDGAAEFTANTILVDRDYNFAVRGDDTVYDKLISVHIPCVPPEREGFTFPEKVYAYKVGNFSDIAADKIIDASDDSCLNITGKSGIQHCEFEITIGQEVSGETLRDAILALRSPEDYELEPGDIVYLYITRKTGTAFTIPGINLADYIDVMPIPLGGSILDTVEGVYYMTTADKGVYTVKLDYDADQIQPATDRFQVALDDEGDYRAKSAITRTAKAPSEVLEIRWGT